jgi:adenosylcobinamide kinase / adenosylcobinamide-phosphate guanylyltransferase
MAVTLLIGGARSGKSSLAVARVLDWQRGGEIGKYAGSYGVTGSKRHVVFVATGSPGDQEMTDRITHHQAERPSSWATVEAPLDLVAGLVEACGGFSLDRSAGGSVAESGSEPALIVDCLSMWVANHLMAPMGLISEESAWLPDDVGVSGGESVSWDLAERELLRQTEESFAILATRSAPTFFVTNEVGLSLVPMSALGRRYRDVLGRVNAKVSLLADEAFLTVAGRVMRLDRP